MAVMDLFSRKIVGWAMRDHMRVEFVSSALTMAIRQTRRGCRIDPSFRSQRAVRGFFVEGATDGASWISSISPDLGRKCFVITMPH
ncbi:hypothetical protein AC629_33675 [Bradyrhizobium sp. NAS80.1]|nr:hypothetical protein AC629_33675 [Bradyrhizobium sp. NAS80.1]